MRCVTETTTPTDQECGMYVADICGVGETGHRPSSGNTHQAQPREDPMALNRLNSAEACSLRILIIEDNTDGRETLRFLLELLGHEVMAAADGIEGVEKALQWHPDVAVVDIGLPRLNGYEVARRLRRELGLTPFLITQTAYSRAEDRQLALASGFDVHLIKPVDPVILISWLEVASQRREEMKNKMTNDTFRA